MKEILHQLLQHKRLSYDQAIMVIKNMAQGLYNDSELASFMTVFMMRSLSIEELMGFRDALRELCIRIDLSDYDPIDLCGTGGDEKNTFNISTLTSFVLAGAGVKVAKHGNYGVSSSSGSSNILEKLGYNFTNDIDKLKQQIETTNICYLHAQLFHPAMKNAGPIRKQLGIKTFFNLLGPLVNPSFPKKQLTGVFNRETLRLYQYLYERSDIKYTIVYNLDGYDEISLTGAAKVVSNNADTVIYPSNFGLAKITPKAIFGGNTPDECFKTFTSILEGNGTKSQNEVIYANTALALQIVYPEKTLLECVDIAKDSLLGKKAFAVAKKLVEINS